MLVELWDVTVSIAGQLEGQGGSPSDAAAARLPEEGVAVTATFLDFPELVLLLSALTLVEVQFHLAEELGTAWLYNGSDNALTFLDDDVGAHLATAWASIPELEILKPVVFGATWELDGVFQCSRTSRDAHPADSTALLLDGAACLSAFFDLVSGLFGEDREGHWADAVSPMDVLAKFNLAVVFSHCFFVC